MKRLLSVYATARHSVSLSSSSVVVDYATECTRNANRFASCESSPTDEIVIVSKENFDTWKSGADVQLRAWMKLDKFPGTKLFKIPAMMAPNQHILFCDLSAIKFRTFHNIWDSLSTQSCTIKLNMFNSELSPELADNLCMSWATSQHKFNFFKSAKSNCAPAVGKLIWPANANTKDILANSKAYTLMRDLVDTPAMDMGPEELVGVAKKILQSSPHSRIETIQGVTNLIAKKYPQIAAVGMGSASNREPVLLDCSWALPCSTELSEDKHAAMPEIVIIGKGIVFDTGGLNIKTGGGMRYMKKDMAGAAQALALASLIIEQQLPVKLRLLLPIAENSVGSASLRPGDVIRSRSGVTTEITNTDAEGRLVLADALCAATEKGRAPALVVDFATLTGAARVALGTDLPALFSNNHEEMLRLWRVSGEVDDPLWVMPLHEPMRPLLKSSVADLVNSVDGPGGAITAALYLSEFIQPQPPSEGRQRVPQDNVTAAAESSPSDVVKTRAPPVWFHIDFMGTRNNVAEPMGLRAVFAYIKQTYCK